MTIPYYLEDCGAPGSFEPLSLYCSEPVAPSFVFTMNGAVGTCSPNRGLVFMFSNPAHSNKGQRQLHQATVLVLDRLAGNIAICCSNLLQKHTCWKPITAFSAHAQACYEQLLIFWDNFWRAPENGKNMENTENVYCKYIYLKSR